jgi:polyhydroxyalkanoate synthase subunit PhaC
MNDQTGTALLHGNEIKIDYDPVVPPSGRAIDHASLPRGPFRDLDRATAAALARMTGGLSPAALWLAYSDWAMHFGAAPGKQLELALDLWQDWVRLSSEVMRPAAERQSETSLQDDRFRGDAWQRLPFRFWYESFLLTEQWWRKATHGAAGVSPHHEDVVSFAARQWLDMFSPSNLPWTNPEVAQETFRTGGRNLVTGFANWSEDRRRALAKQPPAGAEAFEIGKNLATTPGKVVFRNHLMELIQYMPVTETVHPEPVLIVPAWIMKYYILDLSPQNSLIGYLVSQGYTVFCISWRNVTADDRDVSLEDYRRLGVMAALDTITSIVPGQQVHAAGYCLGGTLLTLAAAAMTETADHRLKTVTLLAAQTDFSEPGELDLFIDDSQVSALESMMLQNGTLDATQMAGAFQMLNSNDLIWSRLIHDYLMGERTPMIDLMAWNADTTRMPYRMHSDYLRKLFLGNDLASGRYVVDGHAIAVQNIRAPIFAVGTKRDHVAPWHSVYKIHYLADTDVTFALTSGGHNAGIVSEPGHSHRHFRIAAKAATDPCLSADEWMAATPMQDGSWWLAWNAWLAGHSTSPQISPPAMGGGIVGQAPLTDAPGTYVLQP